MFIANIAGSSVTVCRHASCSAEVFFQKARRAPASQLWPELGFFALRERSILVEMIGLVISKLLGLNPF